MRKHTDCSRFKGDEDGIGCYKLGFLEMFDHGSLKSQGLIREHSLRNLPEPLDLEVVLKE